MSEPNQPHQIIESEHVRRLRENFRRIGRELPRPEDLVPDFMKPLFMRGPNQVTTPARTLSPLQPTFRPVPQSLNSGDSNEQIGEKTSTEEEEKEQGRKSNGLQPEIGIAIQQRTKDLKEEQSNSVSPPQQQRITSFKDALEMPLQATSSSTTLMQLVYSHIVNVDRTLTADMERIIAAYPSMRLENIMKDQMKTLMKNENLMNSPKARSLARTLASFPAQEVEQASQIFEEFKSKGTAHSTLNHRHKPRFYAVLGGPGSGKSTICDSWAKLDGGVMHIAIGDILRNEAKRPDSPYAEVLKANLVKGAIGDPEMTVGLIKDNIRTKIKAASGPIHTYLLDGFPRALASAQYFERTVGPISKVIVLDIPEDTLLDRCRQRNRSDDNDRAIRERIRVYNTKSAEVVDFYDRLGKLSRVTQISEEMISIRAATMSEMVDSEFPFGLDIPEGVLRDVVACARLLYDLRGGWLHHECSERDRS